MAGTVLIPNVMALLLLLVLLFSANNVSRYTMLPDSKIFVVMLTCNFAQCIGEILSYAVDGVNLPGFREVNLLVNCLLFVVNILFAFLWVMYASYKIFEDVERTASLGKKMVWPALAVVVFSVVSVFDPVFFGVSADNHYFRTDLYAIPFLITYFYLAYGTIFIYRHKSQARKYVFLPAGIFMVPILLGSAVQYFFYGVSTVWAGVAVALVAVYINVQNETSYTDALSGLYTRIYMHQYLETAIRKKGPQKKIAGIMLDVDEFKKINDRFGHLVGDEAIRSTGKLLRNALGNDSIVVRYGGDEFVVLRRIETQKDIEDTLQKISAEEKEFNRTQGKQYTLRFSKGYSVLDQETDTVDSFLERMDDAMYEMKKAHKQQREAAAKAAAAQADAATAKV